MTIFVLLGAVVVALVIWRVFAVTTMADPAPHGRMADAGWPSIAGIPDLAATAQLEG